MYWISKSIHQVRRLNRRTILFLAALGPGLITMIADNDAGGISTYAQTGAKTGFSLLWAMILLLPMAYYVQEMTVRLGAVTKRGHAEAIFDGFGKFWGCFSIFDLAVINWLTLVTEYIGMTQVLHGQWGQWAKVLFAVGLFDAGLLGALCISLATSWAPGEVFGWAHSLNKTVREAPWFYVAYVLMLMSAGVVSLIASVNLQNIITIFVQVVAVTLLPAALMFLILLLNDKPLMGEHVNT